MDILFFHENIFAVLTGPVLMSTAIKKIDTT